jgi:polar amino acid transport system substrate-binding protein
MKRITPARLLTTGLLAVAALGLTACGTESPEPASGDATAPFFDLLPEDVQSDGKILVATNATYPPIEYYDTDNETIIGLDPDLGAALGEQLGIEFEFVNVTEFDQILPGLAAGRYDIGMAFFSDLKDRYDKTHFVDYFQDAAVAVVAAGNPEGVGGLDDLCGHTVVVQQGSFAEVNTADDAQAACAAAGEDAVDIVELPAATDKQTQLLSGRADVAITSVTNASFLIAEAPDDFEIAGDPVSVPGSLVGVAVPAEDTVLRDAIQAAMQALIDSGEYLDILTKYDLQNGAVDEAVVNGDE